MSLLLGAAWEGLWEGSITKPAVYFQMSKSSKKKKKRKTNVTKVNDDKTQLFCAFGSFFQNKNTGGVLAEFVCVSHCSDQDPSISPIHKSETCTQTRVGGRQGWPQLGSLELGSSLASLTTIIEDYLQDRHRTGFYLQVDRAPEESAVVQRTETHILPAAM